MTTPTFQIIANSDDVTRTIRSRFVSLRLVDAAGLESDTLDLVLSDHDPANAIIEPEYGAELEVSIGYDGIASRMGLYIVDEVELLGSPRQMRIGAHASPHDTTPTGITALQTQRSRSWPAGTTIGAMVERIAADHALAPAVADALKDVQLQHIDQTNESDMNLLTRIAREHDAVAKPGGGRLAMVPKAAATSASGADMGIVTIAPQDETQWSVLRSKRPPAATVIATYRDHNAGADSEVVIGSGEEPIRRLPHTYASASSARRAARAELNTSQRAGHTMRMTMPGVASLIAEIRVLLTGFRPGADGEWSITRVEHSIDDGGFVTSLEGETPSSPSTLGSRES